MGFRVELKCAKAIVKAWTAAGNLSAKSLITTRPYGSLLHLINKKLTCKMFDNLNIWKLKTLPAKCKNHEWCEKSFS
jgi:hypothetical protein